MTKGEATRVRILDAAMVVASRVGVKGLTIGTLAGELGLSKSGLIAHFGSKQALQSAVLDHTVDEQARRMAPNLAATTGKDRLRVLMRGCLDWIDDPAFAGGCPIIAACFSLGERDGAPHANLVAKQQRFQARLAEMAQTAASHPVDGEQWAFEFRAITLMYQHASRVLGDRAARRRAWAMTEALLARLD